MTTSFWTLSRSWFCIWSHLLLIISIWWICKLTFPFLTGLLPTTMNGSGFSIAEKGYLQRIRKDHVRLWCITLKDWKSCNTQSSLWISQYVQKEKIDNVCFQLLNHAAPHPYPGQDKVRQRGSGAESRARALPESQSRTVYANLESNSEPERDRVCQRVAVRASESQSGSHRESQRAIESQREPGREPQREPIRARRNLNIVLLQNN